MKPCTFESDNFYVIIGFAEDGQYFETVKSMEEYISEDKHSEVKNDGECLLNEKRCELL